MRLSEDTSAAAAALLLARVREMSPTERLERLRAMTRAVQQAAVAGIRMRHPEADEREIRLRLAARRLDPDLMAQVFGWDRRTKDPG
jgi:hypothetical protein